MLKFFIAITCLINSGLISGANHYVDKNANGLNDGTNWENAWTSFSNINWNSIQAGDVVYISGGSDSTVYDETLFIGSSGIIGNPITIIKGLTSGHNGLVIIRNTNNNYAIDIGNKSNVIVSDLQTRRQTIGTSVKIDGGTNIILNELNIINNAGGINLENSSNIEIKNCRIISVLNSPAHSDGIYSQRNRLINIHHNYIEIINSNEDGHNDCIQSYLDGNDSSSVNDETMKVWSNTLYQNNTKTSNSSTIFFSDGFGWFTFYNNLMVQPYSNSTGIGAQPTGTQNMKVRAWHNTHIAGINHDKPFYLRYMEMADTVDIVNNLVYNLGSFAKVKINDSPELNIRRWNYNSYYSPDTSWNVIANVDGSINYDWSQWRALGRDQNGFNENPEMINPLVQLNGLGDYSLKENSPLRNAGLNLQTEVETLDLPWETIDGKLRDASPDIGAFTYNIIDITPPELLAAVLIDSSTLRLTFSEILEQSGARNVNNYSISNSIQVFAASDSGYHVTLTTSAHLTGSYTVTVNNVTDLAGNIISPTANSQQYEYIELDLTPPELIGIQIVQPYSVVLDFSEPIDSAQIGNLQNYQISNQVQVTGAWLSETQKRIVLSTAVHDSDFVYSIAVSGIKDLAGNDISEDADSLLYKLIDFSPVLFLQYLINEVDASAFEPGKIPNRTLDGLLFSDPDTSSKWTADNMPQWIQYDLGSVNTIKLIAISFDGWNFGSIYEYSVKISADGNDWNEIISNQLSSSQEWTFNPSDSIDTRYVRIICQSNNQSNKAGIWETRIFGPDSLVPVELVSFTAEVNQDGNVELLWSTATELNNHLFNIERKFETQGYNTIGTLAGHGTTSHITQYHFTDETVEQGLNKYRLLQIDYNGQYSYSNEVEVVVNNHIEFNLAQNYPNPFNPATKIKFGVPITANVSISIYNVIGEQLAVLIDKEFDAGTYEIDFDASNLPSGIYFYKLHAAEFIQTKKMILIK